VLFGLPTQEASISARANASARTVRDRQSVSRRSFPRVALPVIPNEGLLPLAVAQWAQERPRAIFVAGDDATFQALARALKAFLPAREVRLLPAWDSSPYDRSRPSHSVTGTRIATLAWLAEHPGESVLVLTTPEGLLQRIPPPERLLDRAVMLEPGRQLAFEWLQATMAGFGYELVERVEDAGETAIRPGAVDIFPAGALWPVRLELQGGTIKTIRHFDPHDQLTISDVAAVTVLPASEGFSVPGEDVAKERHILPDGPLSDLFALLPDAQLAVMEGFESRIEDWLKLVHDSYRIALTTLREGAPRPPEPARLYLDQDEFGVLLAGRHLLKVRIDDEPDEPATTLAAAARRALELASQGMRVVVCADLPTQTFRDTVARRMRRDTRTVLQLPDWPAAQRLHPATSA
jgi:transcription-repair coupling factor (superfamily II helicase)